MMKDPENDNTVLPQEELGAPLSNCVEIQDETFVHHQVSRLFLWQQLFQKLRPVTAAQCSSHGKSAESYQGRGFWLSAADKDL